MEETVSREIYESTHTLLREILKEFNFKVDAGLSFKLKPTEESLSKTPVNVDAGIGYERKSMIKEVSEFTTIKVNVSHLHLINIASSPQVH